MDMFERFFKDAAILPDINEAAKVLKTMEITLNESTKIILKFLSSKESLLVFFSRMQLTESIYSSKS